MRVVVLFVLAVAASLAVLLQLARRTAATLTARAAVVLPPSVSTLCATLWGRRGAAKNASESQRVAAKWSTVAQRQRAARNDRAVAQVVPN